MVARKLRMAALKPLGLRNPLVDEFIGLSGQAHAALQRTRRLCRRREPRHQRGEPAPQRQLGGVVPFFYDPAAGDHDVANRGCAAGKQKMVERILERRAGHAGMRAFEHQPIGSVTHRNDAGRLTNRLRADPGGVAP